MLRIGLIGIGNMGTPMGIKLLQAGFPLNVFDINSERMDTLARQGATISASSGDAAANADVIITVLTYDHVVEDVILGEGGVLSALKKEATIIECSSIDDSTLLQIMRKVESAGGRFVEAALIGRPQQVERKQTLVLAAGQKVVIDECTPIFHSFGRKVLYTGDFGTAKLLKIANALLNAAEVVVATETLTWSRVNKIVPEAYIDLLSERSPARARYLARILEGHLEREPTWIPKDLHHGLKNAEENEIPMPALSVINAIVGLAKSRNPAGYAFSEMIWNFYEQTTKKEGQ